MFVKMGLLFNHAIWSHWFRYLHSKSVQVCADDGAHDEDGQLEDAKDEAVLGGDTAFFLGLLRIEWGLNSSKHLG